MLPLASLAEAQPVSPLRCAASAVLIVAPVGKATWLPRFGRTALRFAGVGRTAHMIRQRAVVAHVTARAYYLNRRIAQTGYTGRVTPDQVRQLIPRGVRWGGPDRVLRFLAAHDLSHIRSLRNRPDLGAVSQNLMFEPRHRNRARGARNMTDAELARATGGATSAPGWPRSLACENDQRHIGLHPATSAKEIKMEKNRKSTESQWLQFVDPPALPVSVKRSEVQAVMELRPNPDSGSRLLLSGGNSVDVAATREAVMKVLAAPSA